MWRWFRHKQQLGGLACGNQSALSHRLRKGDAGANRLGAVFLRAHVVTVYGLMLHAVEHAIMWISHCFGPVPAGVTAGTQLAATDLSLVCLPSGWATFTSKVHRTPWHNATGS